MHQENTFSLGAIAKPTTAPTLPSPLDPAEFHTRQALREHRQAEEAFYAYRREVEIEAETAAANALAKEVAEANRELSDSEYDTLKRKAWLEQKAKQEALVAKDKQDALERTAFLLSSPPVVDLFHRSEYILLKEFEHWASRNYTLSLEGLHCFQPGNYHVQLTAPPAKKAAAK